VDQDRNGIFGGVQITLVTILSKFRACAFGLENCSLLKCNEKKPIDHIDHSVASCSFRAENQMKRRKRQKKSSLAPRHKHTASERVTQAVLAHDIARYSAETVYYRIATLQKAAAGTLDPGIFAMVAEKMLAAGEAAAIAARQIVPLQRLWTGAWFEQLSALQQAWRQEKIGYDVGRTFTDMAKADS
jgi:hypothetical protein